MSDGMIVQVEGLDRIVSILSVMPAQMANEIKGELSTSAQTTLSNSQSMVPVLSGDLQASGHIEDNGVDIDVVYGDGSSAGTYSYPDNGLNGDMQADGYAWFVELGHLSRAGNPVAPQPFLGPAFEEESQALVQRLGDLVNQ